jgi:acyl carrier protein
MNTIFVDSLKRHANVCQGCFKTVYTLSVQEARSRGIRHIVTGLSRGQLFETRLTEDLFRQADSDLRIIDETVLEARKAYHRVDDAVFRHLDTDMFMDDRVFEEVNFVDFFRFCDVALTEMLSYLQRRVNWVRPADTGRSTNCLINDVGIHIHNKKKGFHNYAFPYSWDVRTGHKTREEALHELNDEIDVNRVHQILDDIGYVADDPPAERHQRLIAWYVGPASVSEDEARQHVARRLPSHMLPSRFVRIDALPLTINGKVDHYRLPPPADSPPPSTSANSPDEMSEVEEIISKIWCDVLRTTAIGLHNNFFEVGGDSLLAMSVVTRVNEAFQVELPIASIFETSSISELSVSVVERLRAEIGSDDHRFDATQSVVPAHAESPRHE